MINFRSNESNKWNSTRRTVLVTEKPHGCFYILDKRYRSTESPYFCVLLTLRHRVTLLALLSSSRTATQTERVRSPCVVSVTLVHHVLSGIRYLPILLCHTPINCTATGGRRCRQNDALGAIESDAILKATKGAATWTNQTQPVMPCPTEIRQCESPGRGRKHRFICCNTRVEFGVEFGSSDAIETVVGCQATILAGRHWME